MSAPQIRTRDVIKIPLKDEYSTTFEVEIQERLQIGELISGPQFLCGIPPKFHIIAGG